jgi:hypothetical protein
MQNELIKTQESGQRLRTLLHFKIPLTSKSTLIKSINKELQPLLTRFHTSLTPRPFFNTLENLGFKIKLEYLPPRI